MVELNSLQRRKLQEFKMWLEEAERLEVIDACPSCRQSTWERIENVDRFGLAFGADLCLSCGLMFTNPRFKEACLPEYYERFYTALTMGREGKEAPKYLVSQNQGKKIYDFIAPLLNRLPAGTLEIGEIGCGAGRNLFEIKEFLKQDGREAQATGCDYSMHYIDYIKKNLGLRFVSGGFPDMIAAGSRFDILILSHVFEHLIDIETSKIQIAQLLKPGGLVYIEVPGLLTFQEKPYYRAELGRFLTHAHIYNFTQQSLLQVMTPEFDVMASNEDVQALFSVSHEASVTPVANKDETAQVIRQHLSFVKENRETFANALVGPKPSLIRRIFRWILQGRG